MNRRLQQCTLIESRQIQPIDQPQSKAALKAAVSLRVALAAMQFHSELLMHPKRTFSIQIPWTTIFTAETGEWQSCKGLSKAGCTTAKTAIGSKEPRPKGPQDTNRMSFPGCCMSGMQSNADAPWHSGCRIRLEANPGAQCHENLNMRLPT